VVENVPSEVVKIRQVVRSCRHLRHSITIIPICFWRATCCIPHHLYSIATRHISSIWLKPSSLVRMDWTGTKVLIPCAVPFTKTTLETAKVLKYTMVLCPVSNCSRARSSFPVPLLEHLVITGRSSSPGWSHAFYTCASWCWKQLMCIFGPYSRIFQFVQKIWDFYSSMFLITCPFHAELKIM